MSEEVKPKKAPKPKKFTFKNYPKPTGLAAVARPFSGAEIRLGGKDCGSILPPNVHTRETQWRVQFHVKKTQDDGSTCPFTNVILKVRLDGLNEAKEWLNTHFETLTTKLDIYTEEG